MLFLFSFGCLVLESADIAATDCAVDLNEHSETL